MRLHISSIMKPMRNNSVSETIDQFGLRQKVTDAIAKIFSGYPGVEKVVVFGSRAMGRYKEGSDIDLAVYGKSLSHADLLALYSRLEDLDLIWEIDLLFYNEIYDPEVKEHIDRVGKIFYIA